MAGTDAVDPGTVMVLDNHGAPVPSSRAYDRCVAGIISGAGTYRPAIVLDKQRKVLSLRHTSRKQTEEGRSVCLRG
jgi:hypothetical protein